MTTEEPTPRPPVRSLDMTSLKALAHPLRVRMLDVLTTYGPQTASSLAERLGESSGVTSYHLRQLEKHLFIREVDGRGTARERWWERTPGGITVEARDLPPTEAAKSANAIVIGEWQRHRDLLLNEFIRRSDDELSDGWLDASVMNTSSANLTSAQLAELTSELERVTETYLDRYRHQMRDPVPGSRPVQVHLNAFPVMDADAAADVIGPVPPPSLPAPTVDQTKE